MDPGSTPGISTKDRGRILCFRPMFKDYFNKIDDLCDVKGFSIKTMYKIGPKRDFPLFKIILNSDRSARRNGTVCITGGIHGDETAGPFGLLKFLENYKPNKDDPRLIILPVLNPFGFVNNCRTNQDGLNLNRHFFKWPSPRDVKKLKNLLRFEKIDLFMSVHEDDEERGFYIYQFGQSRRIANKIIDFLRSKTKVCTKPLIYNHKAKDGVVCGAFNDGSMEEWVYKKKKAKFSYCLEVPDCLPLKKRSEIVAELLMNIVGRLELRK